MHSEGSMHLILSSHKQRIWVSRRCDCALKLAVRIQYYSILRTMPSYLLRDLPDRGYYLCLVHTRKLRLREN